MDLTDPYFSTDPEANPLLHNWTKVYVRYCDGGYYSGDRNEVVPVSASVAIGPNSTVISNVEGRSSRGSGGSGLLTFLIAPPLSPPPPPPPSAVYFRGRYITEALIADLSSRFGLGNATDIVFSGCSAGAIHMLVALFPAL
jgi:hypothetical protein